MDAIKYLAAKAKGTASITLHGESTLLVSIPAGFDPQTGEALPNDDRGYQPADIKAMRDGAEAAVTSAEDALEKARENLVAFEAVMAEVEKLVPTKDE